MGSNMVYICTANYTQKIKNKAKSVWNSPIEIFHFESFLKNGHPRPLVLIFIINNYNRKIVDFSRIKWSDHRGRRRSRWPLDQLVSPTALAFPSLCEASLTLPTRYLSKIQCDLIGRMFTSLANCKYTLANFTCSWANFHCFTWQAVSQTFYPSGHTAHITPHAFLPLNRSS